MASAHGSPLCQDMAEVGDLRADPAGAVPTGGDMISNPNLVGAATPPLPFHGSAPRKATGPPLRSPGSLPRSLRDGPGAALDPGASMAPASTQCGQARPAPPRAALPVSTPRRTRSSKFKPPWFEGIARLAWLVADPGSACPKGRCSGLGRSRWFVESSRVPSRVCRFASSLVGDHAGVDDIGESSFECAHGLH